VRKLSNAEDFRYGEYCSPGAETRRLGNVRDVQELVGCETSYGRAAYARRWDRELISTYARGSRGRSPSPGELESDVVNSDGTRRLETCAT
jgi:hypothetical protein